MCFFPFCLNRVELKILSKINFEFFVYKEKKIIKTYSKRGYTHRNTKLNKAE